MRIGSLVECVSDITNIERSREFIRLFGYAIPEIGGIYTVRGFTPEKGAAIYLEEIVNPKVPNDLYGMIEWGFNAKHFRELQPPMDLSELLEETQLITV
jgi:hypothetical protein